MRGCDDLLFDGKDSEYCLHKANNGIVGGGVEEVGEIKGRKKKRKKGIIQRLGEEGKASTRGRSKRGEVRVGRRTTEWNN